MAGDGEKTREQLLDELADLRTRLVENQKTIENFRQTEKALKRSEKRWRALVENAPNVIMIVNGDGIIQFINHTVPGLKVEDALGTSIYDYIEPRFHAVVRETTQKVFDTGQQGMYQIMGTGPDGTKSWYMTQIGPLMNEKEVAAVTLICADITEHKKTEDALRDSEEKIEALLNVPDDMILLVDCEMIIHALNDAAARRLRKDKTHLIGTVILDYFPSGVANIRKEMASRVVRTLQPVYFEDKWDGRYFDNSIYPIIGSQGVERLAIFARDITERRRAEESLTYIRDCLESNTGS